MAEQSSNVLDALQSLINARLIDVNTSLPATIVSYSNGIARVMPKAKKRFADGDVLDYPIIPNVRVCWPSFAGGAAGIKGPVKAGDNCLLVFSQQAIDGSDDLRMFDLQDAYAVMCDLGNVGGDSDNNDDLTLFFGGAYLRITESGELKINAPGGTNIKTNSMSLTSIDGGASQFALTGNLNHTEGTITSLGKRIDGTHTHNETGTVTSAPNA